MEKNDQKLRSNVGRRFDEEFKRDAVRMLESGVRTARQLAGELGVMQTVDESFKSPLLIITRTGEIGDFAQVPCGQRNKALL